LCDGRALSRPAWPALFEVIGTSHGTGVSPTGVREGDFNLPDYRGRFLRGVDLSEAGTVSGADPDAESRAAARAGSGNAGNRVGSYQSDATALPRDPTAPFAIPALRAEAVESSTVGFGRSLAMVPHRASSVILVGGGDAETRPKNVAVRWIIRAVK
jgi:hypothetical protein